MVVLVFQRHILLTSIRALQKAVGLVGFGGGFLAVCLLLSSRNSSFIYWTCGLEIAEKSSSGF